MEDRSIGEIFIVKGYAIPFIVCPKIYLSKKKTCYGCAFNSSTCNYSRRYSGKCGSTTRKDKIGVIFKQVYKFMDSNELRITIPQGMVIDVVNSNLERGIIRFKKECPTYDQINEYLLRNNIEGWLNISAFPDNSYFRSLVKLFNITLYFNNASNKTGRFHILNGVTGYYTAATDISGMPEFRSREDAELVIDNFQDILDEIFK